MKRIILLIALVFITTIKAEATPEIYTSQPIRDIQASAYVHEISSTQQPLEIAQNNDQNQPIEDPFREDRERDEKRRRELREVNPNIRDYTIREIQPRIAGLLADPTHSFSKKNAENDAILLYLRVNSPKYREYKQNVDTNTSGRRITDNAIRALLRGDDAEVDREIEVNNNSDEIGKRLAGIVASPYSADRSISIPERDDTYIGEVLGGLILLVLIVTLLIKN